MIKKAFYLALLISIALFCKSYGDVYTVGDVEVDAVADQVEKARDYAVTKAQKVAWKKLLQELSVAEDVAAGDVPEEEFVYFIKSYEIQKETFSARNYKATISVSFQPSAVRDYFRTNKIPYTEKMSEKSVILPIYIVSDSRMLWHENNIWLSAWAENGDKQSKLNPFVVPINDLADQHDVSLDDALSHNHTNLSKIAIRYGAQNAIVAVAVVNATDYETPRVQVSLAKVSLSGDVSYMDFILQGYGDEEPLSLLNRSVLKSIEKIDSDWKQDNKIQFDDVGNIDARVQIQGLSDWNIVRQRIKQVPIIQKMDVSYMNAFEIGVKINYRGSPQNLKSVMPKFGLQLLGDESNWVIVRTENLGEFESSDPRMEGAKDSMVDR